MSTSTLSPDRPLYREHLAVLAEKIKAKLLQLNGRVEKALKLALLGDVHLHEDGTATVYSSSDPTQRYEIIEGTCTCRDYEQAPNQLCAHRLSAGLARRANALVAQTSPVQPVKWLRVLQIPLTSCRIQRHWIHQGAGISFT